MNPISGAMGRDCMAADFALFPPRLSCHCLGNFLHLPHCNSVPAPKRFKCKGDEGDTLSLTVISCSSHFPLDGEAKTVPWGYCSFVNSSLLQCTAVG